MVNAREIAQQAAEAADSKKAFDILILDLRDLTSVADYFVLCSGGSTTQVGAITDGIGSALAREGVHPGHIEGAAASTWVLMDYGDVVIHIFEEQTRAYYCLERLWGDAPRVPVATTAPALQGAPA
jgi:ribosome-associated protein